MSNREMLYRSVLKQGTTTTTASTESTTLPSKDLSPMSSLTLSFHHATPFSNSTPRRKLSLNSTTSDSSFNSCELSFGKSNDRSMEEHGNTLLLSPTPKKYIRDKEHFSPRSDESTLMSPPPAMNLLSPSRKMMARDKENFPSPYFSPSHSNIPHRPRSSPLQDVQNTVNRNLTFSPMKKRLQMISPTKLVLSSPHKPSTPDDFDTTSQDSGYSESGKKMEDCFSIPVSCAPRKLNLDLSPPKVRSSMSHIPANCTTTAAQSPTPKTVGTSTPTADTSRKPKRFSLNKVDEEDSMLMDLLNDSPNKGDQPLGFASLLSAPIQSEASPFDNSSSWRPTIKRCLSMVDITPTSSRVESVISNEQKFGRFKRPEAPVDLTGEVEYKRRREDFGKLVPLPKFVPPLTRVASTSGCSPLAQRQVSAPEAAVDEPPKLKIVRSHSESHVSIMKALNKCSNSNRELTGDFSKPIALPTIEGGKHPDLKAISVDTMAALVRGRYSDQIASFKILDCRYPYEFEGGHIDGAELFHHPKMVIDHLMSRKGAPVIGKEESPRHILIFHCEFSAERGPKAQRLLRETDRTTNKEHYPALHFPETYLLEGGYKAFFEKYPDLCTPQCYVRMLDSNHAEDLKHFRGKSKSWQAENKQSKSRSTLPRTGLKRLGL